MTSPDEPSDTLAAAIIRARKVAGSQPKLAQEVGTTERTVKRWERGAVPHPKFRPALIERGVDPRLFARAEILKEVETRLRAAEGEIARIRELLE